MQIGIFSNGSRGNRVAKLSYDEDLYEVIVADRLGMREAWISEHGTFLNFQAPDQLPCADLFICKAAALTTQIRMGPGIRPLPFFHPLQVATDAAVCDHLTDGRYIGGFGVGINVAKNTQRGPMPADPRLMFRESVGLAPGLEDEIDRLAEHDARIGRHRPALRVLGDIDADPEARQITAVGEVIADRR